MSFSDEGFFFRLLDHPRFWRGIGLILFLSSTGMVAAKPELIERVLDITGGRGSIGLLIWSGICVIAGWLINDFACSRELGNLREMLDYERARSDLNEKRISAMRTALSQSFMVWPETTREAGTKILVDLDKALDQADDDFRPRRYAPRPVGRRHYDGEKS